MVACVLAEHEGDRASDPLSVEIFYKSKMKFKF